MRATAATITRQFKNADILKDGAEKLTCIGRRAIPPLREQRTITCGRREAPLEDGGDEAEIEVREMNTVNDLRRES